MHATHTAPSIRIFYYKQVTHSPFYFLNESLLGATALSSSPKGCMYAFDGGFPNGEEMVYATVGGKTGKG